MNTRFVPKQSVSPFDHLSDAEGNPVLFNKIWWLFFGGSGQAASESEAGFVELTIIGGHITPDLSLGKIQHVLLDQDVILDAPVAVGQPGMWTLIIDQDPTGNWTAAPDASYFLSLALRSGPDTRNQIRFFQDSSNRNSVSGAPSMEQPIPV